MGAATRTASADGSRGSEPKRTKGERTRARLIDVAATCFAERGYRATTFDDLVEASGMSRGAVHFHFATKDELGLAVLVSRQDAWRQHVQAMAAGQPSAAAILAALAPTLLELHASDPTGWTMSVVSKELASVPALAPAAAKVTKEWIDWLTVVVRRGQEEGSVRAELDPASVATVLFAAMDGLRQTTEIVETPRRRRRAFQRHVDTMSAVLQHGILVAPRDSRSGAS